MTDNEKKFVEDWHFYHGKGKWQFIVGNGVLMAVILCLLFSVLKFFFTESIDMEGVKRYFFTTTFALELLISVVLLAGIIGYFVWQISDKHYEQLMEKENDK
jgi:uncharacterized protein involved in cysteine biosynthesis